MPLKIQVWILQDPCTLRVIIHQVERCTSLMFTCCITRAVHLELITDVNSNSVILALRWFISRWEIPLLFISDNFKTFKAVAVKRFCNTKEIVWKFILERSPWWGGFYERLISNSKIVLEESSLESVFILSGVVYRIDRDRKCIEFATIDVFKWWNLLWKFDSIFYVLWEIIQR